VGPRLGIGSVLGRTFDTFGREWSLFLVLAVPAAIGAVLQLLVTPTVQSAIVNGAYRPAPPPNLWLVGTVGIVLATLGGLSGLACAIATDRLWRGEVPGIVETARTTARSVPRAIPIWILAVVVQVIAVVATAGIKPPDPYSVPPTGTDPSAAAMLLAVPFVLTGLFVVIYVGIRLSLVLPVIALETGSILGVLPRAWRISKGHTVALFVIALMAGLCAVGVAWGASLFLLFGDNRAVAGIAIAIATLVTSPITGIWVAIAWGDLVGGRHADSPVMARGRGRWTAVAMIGGLGVLLVIAGIGITGAAISRLVPA
jgi:hypothetical protein